MASCHRSNGRSRRTPPLSHIFGLEGLHRDRAVQPAQYMTEFGREVYGVFSSFVDIDYAAFVECMTSVLPGLNEAFMVDCIRRLTLEARYHNVVWDTAPLICSHLRTSGDRREVSFTMVTNSQALADCQQPGVQRELGRYELRIDRIVADNVVQESDSAFLARGMQQQRPLLQRIRDEFARLQIVEMPLFPKEVRGLERLRAVGGWSSARVITGVAGA